MSTISLDGVDGYAYADIDGATRLAGPLRSARKVLPRTTIDLARHATYALAAYGINGGAGGAAALNFDRKGDDAPGERFGAFGTAVSSWAEASDFTATALLGLAADEAGESPRLDSDVAEAAALRSVIAAANVAGTAVIAVGPAAPELSAAAESAGAASVATLELDDALGSGTDVVLVDVATGALDHSNLDSVNVGRIASMRPLATTARGLAVASRAGTVIVPDFVSAGGPVLASLEPTADIDARTAMIAKTLDEHGTNAFIAAAEAAEAFLRTWTEDVPFGRPLAP